MGIIIYEFYIFHVTIAVVGVSVVATAPNTAKEPNIRRMRGIRFARRGRTDITRMTDEVFHFSRSQNWIRWKNVPLFITRTLDGARWTQHFFFAPVQLNLLRVELGCLRELIIDFGVFVVFFVSNFFLSAIQPRAIHTAYTGERIRIGYYRDTHRHSLTHEQTDNN